MWLRIALKNYRSIESAEVELAPFTVLVGPNGSGKTNFVDALVLSSELGIDAASAIQRRGGLASIRRWGVGDDDTLQVRVRASGSREEFASRYVEQFCSIAPEAGNRWRFLDETLEVVEAGKRDLQFTREGGRGMQGGGFGFTHLPPTTSILLYARQIAPEYVIDVHRLRLDLAEMTVPQPPGEAGRLQENGRNIASVLGRLRSQDRRAFDFILLSMRRLIPGLEDIFVEEAGGFLVLRFSQRQPMGVAHFAAANMSEGALRTLGIIVAAQTLSHTAQPLPPAAQLLIVEEPEVAIHPGAAALLFEVLKLASQRGSVLVTTHSPELLDAAQDEEILVCGYRNGTTRIGPLSTAQREVVREGLLSLSELARSEPLRIEGEEPESLDPRDLT
ncbi:AAA family ATPase [Archangium violaceum]|uniref:AAA family ATPase n=1 Tax=Archangium violaceum TaxID=83451 RepID=UPI00194E239A|nr:AAA family ATPase [Archangium violaceum]QRN96194.1 AAA family ATPase [Archangium violaceum]